MPTLRMMLDNSIYGQANDTKVANTKNASPLARHVSNHIQDPVGATKESLSNLTEKKLVYEQAKQDLSRQLAPVKSIIQNIEQEHDLNQNGIPDELENNPDLNPAARGGGPGMANRFAPDNGVPPNMAKEPGKENMMMPNPGMNMPGAGPKIGDELTMPQHKPAAKSGMAPKAKMSDVNQSKLSLKNRPGMQQPQGFPPKRVKVVVRSNSVSPGASRSLATVLPTARIRSMSDQEVRCGLGACSDTKKGMKAKGTSKGALKAWDTKGRRPHSSSIPKKSTVKSVKSKEIESGGPGSGRRPGGAHVDPTRTAFGRNRARLNELSYRNPAAKQSPAVEKQREKDLDKAYKKTGLGGKRPPTWLP